MKGNRLIPKIFWLKGALVIVSILACLTDVLAITVVYPTSGNHLHTAYDPAGSDGIPPPDSFVFLNPDPIQNPGEFFLLSAVSQVVKDELAAGDTAFPGWTFDYTFSTLSGTMFVDEYKAQYLTDHVGGGLINTRYKKGAGDPANLRWIQLITTTNPLHGATSPYIDPYPNDGTDGAPFYWHSGEIADHIAGAKDYGFGKDYDLHFKDFSRREHPLPIPFDPIKWRAELYLVEWDGAKHVTFHDGIQWGWEMHPIPEPSTIFLLATGLAGYFGFVRYRRRDLTDKSEKGH